MSSLNDSELYSYASHSMPHMSHSGPALVVWNAAATPKPEVGARSAGETGGDERSDGRCDRNSRKASEPIRSDGEGCRKTREPPVAGLAVRGKEPPVLE